jgi:hypothetical protein
VRHETEIEALLKELQAVIDAEPTMMRRPDPKRMAGTVAMVSLLEWALGAQGDHTRAALVKFVKVELANAVRHANK